MQLPLPSHVMSVGGSQLPPEGLQTRTSTVSPAWKPETVTAAWKEPSATRQAVAFSKVCATQVKVAVGVFVRVIVGVAVDVLVAVFVAV